jgi:hypothetical protein
MHSRLFSFSSFLIFLCVLCFNSTPLIADQNNQNNQIDLRIKNLFLKNQKISVSSDRLRILRIVPEETDPKEQFRNINTVYAVDYDSLVAYRADVDPDSGRILKIQKLRGTPQSSEDERADGRTLLLNDDELGGVARAAARIEAGFVVDAPPNSPPGRYLEFHILSPDATEIAYEVFVDIANSRIVLPAR